ncbi:hypothetical protein PFISCL1PPCAC_17469, partial [Pristionchus fissidentatus]
DFVVIIPQTVETVYGVIILIEGLLSTFISILLIFIIGFKSPKISRNHRIGLVSLQSCYLLFAVIICCLWQPVAVAPFFAGYCMGILCEAVDYHLMFVSTFIILPEIFALFLICMLQRHQSMLPSTSRLKLKSTSY